MNETTLIPRQTYIDKINSSLGKELIIVLTGQRRVGKSYLLKLICQEKSHNPANNVIYIDKEKREFDDISDYRTLNEYISSHFNPDKHNYILIDEVQDINNFEKSLRSWRTETNTEIIVTGSNAHILSSQLTTLIGGRFRQIYILPLSYSEFLLFHNLENNDESLSKYIEYGGMPGLIKFGLSGSDTRQYLSDVYNTAILKDVLMRNEVRNISFLENLSTFIADNTGKQMSPFSISKYLKSQGAKMTSETIANYLKYFEQAYLLRHVERFDIHGKRLLEGLYKYYFEDIGIRNAIVGGTREGDIEKLIENVIYHELIRRGYEITVGSLQAGEIDFVCTKPSVEGRIYIQASYLIVSEETHNREFGALHRINDNYPKYVISMTPLVTHSDDNGVIHLGLRKFLSDPNSIS